MNQRYEDPSGAVADAGVTRRRLLRLGLLAAGAGAVAIPAGALGVHHLAAHDLAGRGRPGAPSPDPLASMTPWHEATAPLPSVQPVVEHHPSPVATRSSAPPPADLVDRPTWLSTWDRPVDRLDDFLVRSASTRLPRNAIMLTIDDGPHPEWTPKYLRLLAKYGVTATFCMIGRQVADNASLVRAVVGEGHHIGNHTFTHPLGMPKLGADRIRTEMEDTTDAIVSASGFRPRQFRSPGGEWGPAIMAEAARQEMLPLGWDVDPRDWSKPGEAKIQAAMLAARPHDIILCHDGGGDRSETFAALSVVVPALLARGWTFVTLPAPQSL